MRILVVEDEKDLNSIICSKLVKEGYNVDACYDGQAALDYMEAENYDGAIMDIMIPNKDGITVLREMRNAGIQVPVLFLTAKTETQDIVRGLDAGASDYMTKPFRTKELVARIYANTRKCGKTEYSHAGTQNASGVYRNGELCLNEADMAVFCRGERTPLTLSEYRLFQIFMRNVGQILTREQLMERLWSVDGAFVDDNTLSVYMRRLRQKLEHGTADAYITTVRGVGYRMERKGE